MKKIFAGLLIGISNLIPGVSGGTIAVILGIYDPLINAIQETCTSVDGIKKHFKFLALIGTGVVSGILGFSSIMDWALNTYPQPTFMLFIGLILGGLAPVLKEIKTFKLSALDYLIPIAPFVLLAYLATCNSTALPITHVTLFLSGFIAAVTMVIPGVSGSFMLLLLGTYQGLIDAVKNFDLIGISIIGLGAILGILLCTKLIHWIISKSPKTAYLLILGLILGSVLKLWPQDSLLQVSAIPGIVLFFIGFSIAQLLSRLDIHE